MWFAALGITQPSHINNIEVGKEGGLLWLFDFYIIVSSGESWTFLKLRYLPYVSVEQQKF